MIANHYYPVLESRALGTRPVGLQRFGLRLVAWRDDAGRAQVFPGYCPHRGADLSQGRVVAGHLTCPWHGFRFDTAGRCRKAPCEGDNGRIPQTLALDPLPALEQDGLLWLWVGDQPPPDRAPFFTGFDAASSSQATYELPYHYSRMVETNLDVFHTPFVHGNVVPGIGTEVRDFVCEGHGAEIRSTGMLSHPGKPGGVRFSANFLAPCLVQLSLGDRMHIITAATPIDEQHSWLWFRYYQDVTKQLWLGRLITWIAIQSELRVVQKQDWRIFARMTPGKLEDAPHNLVGADLAIARYRNWRTSQLSG